MRRTAIPSLLVALAAAGVALGSGCGDDDGDGSGRMGELEFRERAGSLCAAAEQRAVEIEPPGSPAQAAEYAAAMREVLVELRDGLGELEPPEELEASYRSYLEALDSDISAMESLGAAAESGDRARIQQLFRTEIDEEAGQLAQAELGLESCAGAANAIAKTP